MTRATKLQKREFDGRSMVFPNRQCSTVDFLQRLSAPILSSAQLTFSLINKRLRRDNLRFPLKSSPKTLICGLLLRTQLRFFNPCSVAVFLCPPSLIASIQQRIPPLPPARCSASVRCSAPNRCNGSRICRCLPTACRRRCGRLTTEHYTRQRVLVLENRNETLSLRWAADVPPKL